MKPQPPPLADRLLEWFVAPHRLEDLQGDLHEEFAYQVGRVGPGRARYRYWWDVLGFIRPYVIKRKKNEFEYAQPYTLSPVMIRNLVKTARRSLLQNRSFAFINLVGLTLGLGVAMVLFWIVRFEYNFDRYHAKADRLYQIQTYSKFGDGIPNSHVPQGVIKALNNQLPGVEQAVNVYKQGQTTLKVGQTIFKQDHIFFVPPEFLSMIDVEWVSGSLQQSLSAPRQVVLDEETAKRLFKGNPLGQTLYYWTNVPLTVSGIIRKVRPDSEFQLSMIVSRETLKVLQKELQNEEYWGGGDSNNQGYVLLKEGASEESIERSLAKMAQQHMKKGESIVASYVLEPLTSIHFGSPQPFNYTVPRWMFYTLVSVGLFLILIACFNFINLATVQALKRSREIAVRKVLGSSRSQLVAQFFGETALLVFVSIGLGLLLASQLVRYADQLLNTHVAQSNVWTLQTFGFMLALGLLTTLLGGFYPALMLSGFQPVRVLRSNAATSGGKGVTVRGALVVAQFVVAQVLVICTLLGTKQVRYFYEKDLGFDKSEMVTINMPVAGNDVYRERLRQQLKQYPEIKDIAFSLAPPSSGGQWWTSAFHPGLPGGETDFRTQFIDTNFFDFFRIPLVAGRNITRSDTARKANPKADKVIDVVVNQEAIRRMGYQQAEKALGQTFRYWDLKATIVGVAKDYHSQDLKSGLIPHVYFYFPYEFQTATLRIDQRQKAAAVEHIGQHWKALFPDQYYEPKFLEDGLHSFYDNERKLSNFLTLLTVVGLLIGCLGLFGLVSFVVTQRTREIGVRKVLGATVASIVALLSRDFLKLVCIAFLIASPIAYYAMSQFLKSYQYKITIDWTVFALAGVLAALAAIITVGLQSINAALMNPVKSLRSE
jgi:predicted permease